MIDAANIALPSCQTHAAMLCRPTDFGRKRSST